jgi:hypothetical protein
MPISDRREHRRYIVEGRAIAATSSRRLAAALVDLSVGGVLLITVGGPVPVGEQIEVKFAIAGYHVEINAKGRVARTAPNIIAIAFSDPPAAVYEAVLWLEAGVFSSMISPPKA